MELEDTFNNQYQEFAESEDEYDQQEYMDGGMGGEDFIDGHHEEL